MNPFVTRNQATAITEAVRTDLQLLSPDEVCSLLRVTKDWLYDQVQANRIPFRRLGQGNRSPLRFDPDELRAWLDGEWAPPTLEDEPEPVASAPPRGRPRKN